MQQRASPDNRFIDSHKESHRYDLNIIPFSHRNDFVVVPLTAGQLLLTNRDGEQTVELEAGRSYFREKGIEHNAVNESAREVALLEIEIKTGGAP